VGSKDEILGEFSTNRKLAEDFLGSFEGEHRDDSLNDACQNEDGADDARGGFAPG